MSTAPMEGEWEGTELVAVPCARGEICDVRNFRFRCFFAKNPSTSGCHEQLREEQLPCVAAIRSDLESVIWIPKDQFFIARLKGEL